MKNNLIYVDFKKGVRIQEYQYDKDYQKQSMPDNVVPMFLENQIA